MKSVCVLLGSNMGSNPIFLAETKKIAEHIVNNQINLVYGGGNLGLMGTVADTVLTFGGTVTGVITEELYNRSEAHLNLTNLIIVESMQERKKRMMQLSDGFIVLPGGLGTLEELFEIWNASKLRLHNKPIGLLNTSNYYNKLLEFITHSSENNFLTQEQKEMIFIDNDAGVLLNLMIDSYNYKLRK